MTHKAVLKNFLISFALGSAKTLCLLLCKYEPKAWVSSKRGEIALKLISDVEVNSDHENAFKMSHHCPETELS